MQQSTDTDQAQTSAVNLSEKVDPKFVSPLVVLAFISIFVCCVSSAHCVRTARDCKIALNAMTIRREYQRNMQLYCLMKEKMLIDASKRRGELPESSQPRETISSSQASEKGFELPPSPNKKSETSQEQSVEENQRLLKRLRENRKNLKAKRKAQKIAGPDSSPVSPALIDLPDAINAITGDEEPEERGEVEDTMSEKLQSEMSVSDSDDSSGLVLEKKLDSAARTRMISRKYKEKLLISIVQESNEEESRSKECSKMTDLSWNKV